MRRELVEELSSNDEVSSLTIHIHARVSYRIFCWGGGKRSLMPTLNKITYT